MAEEKKDEVKKEEEKKEGTKYDTKKVLSSHGLSLKASMESDKDPAKMTSTETASSAPKEQAFFAEEASKQILIRIAEDPELCDASFIVEDVEKEVVEKEEEKVEEVKDESNKMHQQNAARPKEVQEQIRPSSPSRQSGKDDFYRNSKLSAKRTSIFCGRS